MALDAPAGIWPEDDPRSAITVDHLLCMRDGLEWAEDYVDEGGSNVIEMLFGDGKGDMAAYAAAYPTVMAGVTEYFQPGRTVDDLFRDCLELIVHGPAAQSA